MKIMANHSSATVRSETPHLGGAIKRRAQSLINDKSIDAATRTVLRYGFEVDDPLLADLVRRVDAGETIIDDLNFLQIEEEESVEEKVEILTEMICRTGEEPGAGSVALLVLMATLEDAAHPKVLANLAKHFAFTRCGELNVHDMVDAQVAAFARELFAGNALAN